MWNNIKEIIVNVSAFIVLVIGVIVACHQIWSGEFMPKSEGGNVVVMSDTTSITVPVDTLVLDTVIDE